MVSYLYVTVDVTKAIRPVTLRDKDTGLAVLVRRGSLPIGFFLAERAGGHVSSEELDSLIGSACGRNIIRDAIVEELGGRGTPSDVTVTVAICTHDRTQGLGELLRGLSALPGSDTLDILVVDNAPSSDATRALVATLPAVRYVREDRTGLDFARNRAVAEARGDVVAFLDDDVEVDQGWLDGLRLAWGEHPDAGCVTGLVLPYELESPAQITFERYGGFRRGFDTLRYVGPSLPGNPLYPLGAGIFGAGCNMSYRRTLLQELGGFDEALDTGRPLPGGGDIDMFYRVVAAGHPLVYEPRFAVFHKHRREHEALRRQLWTWGTGFMAYVVKTWRADPAQTMKVSWLLAWWFRAHSKEVVRSVLRRGPLAPDLAMAQLAGGIVGLAGSYGRSRRRSAAIDARVTAEESR